MCLHGQLRLHLSDEVGSGVVYSIVDFGCSSVKIDLLLTGNGLNRAEGLPG